MKYNIKNVNAFGCIIKIKTENTSIKYPIINEAFCPYMSANIPVGTSLKNTAIEYIEPAKTNIDKDISPCNKKRV